jgi:hypothetical protein
VTVDLTYIPDNEEMTHLCTCYGMCIPEDTSTSRVETGFSNLQATIDPILPEITVC